jgi:hypothetical protein
MSTMPAKKEVRFKGLFFQREQDRSIAVLGGVIRNHGSRRSDLIGGPRYSVARVVMEPYADNGRSVL